MRRYRSRIYARYSQGGRETDNPVSVENFKSRAPYLKKIIKNHFPPNKNINIVDLGCGQGAFLYFLRSEGFSNLTGVDISTDQTEIAKKLGVEGIINGHLMETLAKISDNSQDIVIAFDVIEHFTKIELLPFVDEVHRVLRSNGKWIIHAPNGESPFFGRIRYGDFTHEQAFTRNSISQLLLASGFNEVKCFEDKPVVHGVKSAIRRILWEGFRLIFLLFNASETGCWDNKAVFSQNLLTIAKAKKD